MDFLRTIQPPLTGAKEISELPGASAAELLDSIELQSLRLLLISGWVKVPQIQRHQLLEDKARSVIQFMYMPLTYNTGVIKIRINSDIRISMFKLNEITFILSSRFTVKFKFIGI